MAGANGGADTRYVQRATVPQATMASWCCVSISGAAERTDHHPGWETVWKDRRWTQRWRGKW